MQTRTTPALVAVAALGLVVGATQAGCHDTDTRIYALPQPAAQVTLDPLASALAGGTLTLNGSNFINGTTRVDFGATNDLAYTFVSASQLIVTVPPDTGTGTALVTVSNSAANLAQQTFVYATNPAAPPVLVSMDPTFGGEGSITEVTLVARNTDAVSAFGSYLVSIGPFPTIGLKTAVTDPANAAQEILTFDVPPLDNTVGATNVAYPVALSVGTLSSGGGFTFTYTDSVVIQRLSPNQGPINGGVPVTIKGRNFKDPSGAVTVADVQFVDAQQVISVASFTVLDANTIATVVPGLVPGGSGMLLASIVVQGVPGWGVSVLEQGYTGGAVLFPPSNFSPDAAALSSTRVATGFLPGNPTGRFAATLSTANLLEGWVINDNQPKRGPSLSGAVTVAISGVAADVIYTSLDGDTVPDLVAVEAASGGDVWIRTGTVFGAIGVSIAGTGKRVATGDFDRDGLMDLAVVTDTGDVTFITNVTGAPATAAQSLGSSAVEAFGIQPGGGLLHGFDPLLNASEMLALPAELRTRATADDFADLVVVHTDGSVSTVPSIGGTALVSGSLALGGGETVTAATPIELNLDGVVDLACLTNLGRIFVLQGDGSGTFSQVGLITLPTSLGTITATDIVVADTNRDCRADLVVSNLGGEDVLVLLGVGQGVFGDPIAYKGHLQPMLPGTSVGALAATLGNHVLCGVSNADTSRNGVTLLPRASSLRRAGHFPDVLAGAVSATDPAAIPTGDEPRSILLRDVDRDSDNDVIVANFASQTVSVRFNTDGRGALGPSNTVSAAFDAGGGNTYAGPRVLGYGDIDGDGVSDVIVAHDLGSATVQDYVTILRNTTVRGQGVAALTSIATPILTGGKGPRSVWVGDIDGTNGNDVLVLNDASNNVSVLLNDGTGTLALDSLVGTGNSPSAMVVVDVGRPEAALSGLPSATLAPDGLRDLVVANRADDTVSVIYNLGAGSFGLGEALPLTGVIAPSRSLYNLGVAPSEGARRRGLPFTRVEPVDVTVSDLNRDGALDIITADHGTGTVTILYANSRDRLWSPVDHVGQDWDLYEAGTLPISGGASEAANDLGNLTGGAMPLLGSINGLPGVQARKWFLPRDYRMLNAQDTTLIGQPAVVFPAVDFPIAVRAVDVNLDGFPDLVVASNAQRKLVVFNGWGQDSQEGPEGPPAQPGDGTSAEPADPPFLTEVLPAFTFGGTPQPCEAYFRSPAEDPLSPPVPGYSAESPTYTFHTDDAGLILAIDIQQMDQDCPPDIGIVLEDDAVVLLKGR